MTPLRYVLRSIARYRALHAAVALGVVAATAVLTGALLVGDSMRGSLRRLALDGLGGVDAAVMPGAFFGEELAESLRSSDALREHGVDVAPAVLLNGTLVAPSDPPRRASGVRIIGADERFWLLAGDADWRDELAADEIVLNAPLAQRLGVQGGDEVLLRVPLAGGIPAESALGKKDDTVARARLRVRAVIPAEGLGRFTIRPSQQTPLNALVALSTLRRLVDQPSRVNALLLGDDDRERPLPREVESAIQAAIRPSLGDYGPRVESLPSGWLQITSDRMILSDALQTQLEIALEGHRVEPVLTYLANEMRIGDRRVPYSTVAALAFPPGEGLVDDEGTPLPAIGEGQVVLNAWTAEQLQASPGDVLHLTYFEPEDTAGRSRESTVALRVAGVCAMRGLGADRTLTPEVKGFSDQASIDDWDPPFDFDASRIRKVDEDYWDTYRAAPKAFVSIETGQRLWGSRFGRVTSLRIAPRDGLDAETLAARLVERIDPSASGFSLQPLKRRALESSVGSTPFDVLFLAFSFFLIVAALLLVALLFRLTIERRAREIGTLLAIGFTRRRVAGLLLGEGVAVAAMAGVVGLLVGVAYARLMLFGLTTLWVDAIGTPFLTFHGSAASLAIGYVGGLATTALVIAGSVRSLQRIPPRTLLGGRATSDTLAKPRGTVRGRRVARAIWSLSLLGSVVAAFAAMRLNEAAQAGAFFIIGGFVLVFLLLTLRNQLRGGDAPLPHGGLARLAMLNAARNPLRSALSAGLLAAACFLLIAVSAFHLETTSGPPSPDDARGGFSLIAESDLPIYHALNTPEGRFDLGLSSREEEAFRDVAVYSLRVVAGDDASCLNLYQAVQPRLLGVPEAMIERGGFVWAGTAADTDARRANPWRLLEKQLAPGPDGAPEIPVVVEKDTAHYALHLYTVGASLDIRDEQGRPLRLRVVGFLGGGVLAGRLLTSERHLLEYFPSTTGFQMFLIETPVAAEDWQARRDAVAAVVDRRLGDYGFQSEPTDHRMRRYFAVQNTYLLTFQTLGGLGLLLGVVGLAAVQLRNVLDRRGELALLRALGFPKTRLAGLVLLENAALLMGGLGIGSLAAAIAVLPHWLGARAVIPWHSLGLTLAAVVAVGLLSGGFAVREVLRIPVASALKEER